MRGVGLLVAAALLLGAPTRAQARDREAAATHFREGSSLYTNGRWADALAEFEAGYDAYPLRGFLVNIGQCYRKLDRYDEAADAWKRFLATHPGDEKLRTEVEEALAEVQSARAKSVDPVPVSVPVSVPVPVPVAVPAAALEMPPPPPRAEKPKQKRWVWALVGVAAAGVAAAAISVGVVEWQASQPRAGSLGLLDGRR